MTPIPIARQHRLLGTLLLLPFIVWSMTGIFFLVRPGYEQAYESIPVQQYPLPEIISFNSDSQWREVRHFRSILGNHLIVNTTLGWQHLQADTSQPWPLPDKADMILLLEDAFQINPDRYGEVVNLIDGVATTSTNVQVSVDWSSLRISQYGNDSRWIDRIYSLHYLQWTGIRLLDRVLGVGGLLLLLYMTFTGGLMLFGKPRQQSKRSG